MSLPLLLYQFLVAMFILSLIRHQHYLIKYFSTYNYQLATIPFASAPKNLSCILHAYHHPISLAKVSSSDKPSLPLRPKGGTLINPAKSTSVFIPSLPDASTFSINVTCKSASFVVRRSTAVIHVSFVAFGSLCHHRNLHINLLLLPSPQQNLS